MKVSNIQAPSDHSPEASLVTEKFLRKLRNPIMPPQVNQIKRIKLRQTSIFLFLNLKR
jgi:hypothetical protein